jgi:glycosyltransferase involved in cell wall biosynthesis
MRILQVTNGFPPTNSAGVEQYTCQLSRGLSTRHDVRIFCREGSQPHQDYDIIDNVYDGLPVRRVINEFRRAQQVRDFYVNPQIEAIFRETLAEWPPDLIHFQHCIGLSASLLDAALDSGIPHLLTIHDYWFICSQVQLRHRRGHICPGPVANPDCYDCQVPAGGWLGAFRGTRFYGFLRMALGEKAKRRLLGLVARVTPRVTKPLPSTELSPYVERDRYMLGRLARLPLILTPSKFVRDVYIRHGVPADRIRALGLGLDMSPWKDSVLEPAEAAGLRVAYFGTLLQHKGVHVLVEAFRRLRDPHATLRIYGFPVPHDPYIDVLNRLAGQDQRVRLMGRYEHSTLADLLQAADVVVIPSLWHETFSIIARESLLTGTPVIASNVGALPEVINHGENGLLVPHGDADALGGALQALYDGQLLQRLRAGAQAYAPQIKNMAAHVAEIEAVYESLTEANRNENESRLETRY